ncbi:MAG: dockerin type I repeat-containing protein [Planctomycetota bacterium]|nr:dockerin type I repeat-containing protein [Planctomycetota bacterium]
MLIVDPVHWRALSDYRGGPDVPDYWSEFDGAECDASDWIESGLRDWGYELNGAGDDDSSSSRSSSYNLGVVELANYAFTLFHPVPILWQKNIADFVTITVSARQGANNAYPINKSMTEAEKVVARGNRNALRHALWQGLLTRRFGADRAEEIGNIHEEDSENETDSWIDQFNNAVARNIALQCLLDGGCTLEELIRRILEALEDGRFIRTPCDPRVPESLRPPECIDTGDPVPIGDVNSDGSIDSSDLLRASLEYGNQFITADLNSNGIVDAEDIVEIAIIIENQH